MARSDFRFCYTKRVRYAEIDAQAIVFNGRYLDYLDIAITEYWRAVGLPVAPHPDTPEVNVVRNLIEYAKPLRLDEEIDLHVRVSRIGRSSITVSYEFHGKDADDLRASGEQTAVHVNLATGKSVPLPQSIVSLFEDYERCALRA